TGAEGGEAIDTRPHPRRTGVKRDFGLFFGDPEAAGIEPRRRSVDVEMNEYGRTEILGEGDRADERAVLIMSLHPTVHSFGADADDQRAPYMVRKAGHAGKKRRREIDPIPADHEREAGLGFGE